MSRLTINFISNFANYHKASVAKEKKTFIFPATGSNLGLYTEFFFFFNTFYLFTYLFIYGCVGSLFLCEGFLQLRQAGAALHRGAQASHYCGLSCCGARAPDVQAQ